MEFVVVIASAHPNKLAETLESLNCCENINRISEVLVIQNGNERSPVDKFPIFDRLKIRFFQLHRGNKSAALNFALQQLTGNPMLIFFDDDVRVHRETLSAYFEAFDRYGENFYYGGPTQAECRESPPEWLKPQCPWSVSGLKYNAEIGYSVPDLFFLGFNWAVSRGHLVKCGGFDVRFGPGAITGATGQEAEMQDRLNRSGISGCYVPLAKVTHRVPETVFRQSWLVHRRYRNGIEIGMRNRLRFRDWDFGFGIMRQICRNAWALLKSNSKTDPQYFLARFQDLFFDFGKVVGFFWRIITVDGYLYGPLNR